MALRQRRNTKHVSRRWTSIVNSALGRPRRRSGSTPFTIRVPDRLVHHRSKGPVSTPAQRLVELQQEIIHLESELDVANARADLAERRLERFYRMAGTSFGGVTMAQQWADLWLWEAVLNGNQQLRAIFEIGTWQGGLSWWLWAQTQVRRMHFRTYDAIKPEKHPPNFMRGDVFANVTDLGQKFRTHEPCVVFCDGGNKPRELKTFASELRDPGSLLIVHDWGTEMLPEHVPDTVEMIYGDFCEDLGSITRVFRLKGEQDA